MKEININPKILYLATIVIFIAIIGFFTAIYPLSLDEYRLSTISFANTISQTKAVITSEAPRFFAIFYVLFMRFMDIWKICFSIINPFIQLFIIFGMFFVATGRKVNFKTIKDFPLFLLLILMYLLMVPCPSNTLLWISGTMVYSWGFVPALILLCLFRQTIDGKELKSSIGIKILMLIISFAAGMSNENTGPMMIGLTVLFLIYCKFKKIKIPDFYYYVLSGTIIGVLMMFTTGAGIRRLDKYVGLYKWHALPFFDKLSLFFTQHIKRFLKGTFYLPVINLIGLLLILLNKKKLVIKNKDFILSSLFCICGFLLISVLCVPYFMVPVITHRTDYSSAIFFFISFTIMLIIIQKIYRINLTKYLSLFLLIIGIFSAPLIALPYLTLHKSNVYRQQTIAYAKKHGKKEVFVNRLTVLKAPIKNWNIVYYDILWPHKFQKNPQRLNEYYKINLYFEIPKQYSLVTIPI